MSLRDQVHAQLPGVIEDLRSLVVVESVSADRDGRLAPHPLDRAPTILRAKHRERVFDKLVRLTSSLQ